MRATLVVIVTIVVEWTVVLLLLSLFLTAHQSGPRHPGVPAPTTFPGLK